VTWPALNAFLDAATYSFGNAIDDVHACEPTHQERLRFRSSEAIVGGPLAGTPPAYGQLSRRRWIQVSRKARPRDGQRAARSHCVSEEPGVK
jgi:hypothetical protein